MKRYYSLRSGTTASTSGTADGESPLPKKRRRSTKRPARFAAPKKEAQEIVDSKAISSVSDEMTVDGRNNSRQESETTINSLPDKILVKIFEMFSLSTRIRIERVCRRWNAVGRLYSWDHTEKVDYLAVADDLCTSDPSDDDEDDIGEFRREQCRALLSHPRLNNDSLCQILDRSGQFLKSIDLSGYRDTIDYRIHRIIAQQCPNLESINLTGIMVTNSSLSSLAMGCPRLKEVILQRCFQDSIVDRGLSALLVYCRGLKTLNLSENERTTGGVFQDLPPIILRLDLSACYDLRDEGIRAIADRCQSLESLNLDCCDRLSPGSLAYAFSRLPELRELRMNEFYVFSDSPSPHVVAAMQNLSKLSNLTELYLGNNYMIDDTVVCAVSHGCQRLETLDIAGGNKGLTDHSLISLGRFAFRTLKRLNCNYLSGITSDGIKALARCSHLQTLQLHRCERVTDVGLMELAKYCHELRQLDISFCSVSSAAVLSFCNAREQLHEKREAEKNGDAANGEQPARRARMASSSWKRPPPGGIIICASDTVVDRELMTNDWVKLNFREGLSSGPWNMPF